MNTLAQAHRDHRWYAMLSLVGWLAMALGSLPFDGTGWAALIARWSVVPLIFGIWHASARRALGRVLRGELTTMKEES